MNCIACGGTGVSSAGGACWPCAGTGVKGGTGPIANTSTSVDGPVANTSTNGPVAPLEIPDHDVSTPPPVGFEAPIILDTETCLIAPAQQAPQLVCMAFLDGDDEITLLDRHDSVEMFEALLESGQPFGGHNIAFDLAVFAAARPELMPLIFEAYEDGRITDTMIRQQLIDIAEGKYRGFMQIRGDAVLDANGAQQFDENGQEVYESRLIKLSYGIDDLCLRHLGYELPKTEIRLQYDRLLDVPLSEWPQLAKDYVCTDVAVTAEVHRVQEHSKWAQYLVDQHRQVAAAWWIRLMSAWGLRTDAQGVAAFAEELKTEHDEIMARLVEAGLMRVTGGKGKNAGKGVRNTKVVKERLRAIYAARGLTEEAARANPSGPIAREWEKVVTPKGGISTGSDHCEREAEHDPLLKDYSKVSSLIKQLGTDIPLLMQAVEKPLHPRFYELMETGRTSSSPNVQNLPVYGRMRECFVPRQGYVYASADFDGFELRTMSQVCVSWFGQSKLGEALNAGLDPHLVVAGQILKITYDEAVAGFKAEKVAGYKCPLCAGAKLRTDGHPCDACEGTGRHDPVYRARQTAKVAAFGFPGGLGAERMVVFAKKNYNVDITVEDARKLKEDWLAAWPEFNAFFARIGSICDEPKPTLVQLFSQRFRGDVTYTECANGTFQSLAADAAKAAGFLVSKACYAEPDSPLYGSRIVNFIHDELVLEVPDDGTAPEAAEELARLMVKGAGMFLPDVPPKATPQLMRRWSKKAEPIRGADGRLVPWDLG